MENDIEIFNTHGYIIFHDADEATAFVKHIVSCGVPFYINEIENRIKVVKQNGY